MEAFYPLERWALQRIAAEYPDIAAGLLKQFDAATIVSRENTGHGFFTNFTVDRNDASPVISERVIGHLWAQIEDMEGPMVFLVFMEDGFACMLEGAGIDDDVSDLDFSQAKVGPLLPVLYARTRAGYDLPIIDVTHPRFAVADDDAARAARQETFLTDDRQRRRIPSFLMRFLLRRVAKKSRLAEAMFSRQSTYLDGLSTYVMKLGADNLVPPFDSPTDRRFAASSHITLLRLRTQQIAALIAGGIARDKAFARGESLHLVNIAGGPALDSINGLILLKRMGPELLRRPIVIHVLDRNEDGAFFGANALDVLKGHGHPLDGVDATFELHDYDWNEPAGLAQLLARIKAAGGVVAASSEGGLFEYGSDEAIIANLRVLHESARFVAGSVTSGDEIRRRMIAMSGFQVIPRGLDGFRPLAEAAGFTIARSEPALLSDQVLLVPAA